MITFNTSDEECETCSAPPGGQHRSRVCIPTPAEVAAHIGTTTIQHIEVTGDDPDRFVFGLTERIEREAKAAHAHLDAKERALDEHGYGGRHPATGLPVMVGVAPFVPHSDPYVDHPDPTTAAMARRNAEVKRLRASIIEISKQRDNADHRVAVTQDRLNNFQGAIADQAIMIMELRAELTRTRDDAARTRTELMGAVEHAERLIGERNEEREARKTHEARVAHLERLASDRPKLTAQAGEEIGQVLALLVKHEDQIDNAWGLIANASGGDWTKQDPTWVKAAERWRDQYRTRTMHEPPTQEANAEVADPANDGSPLF